MAESWRQLPRWMRRSVLLPALRTVPPVANTCLGNLSRLGQKFLEPLDLPPEQRYLAWNTYFSEAAKRELYREASSRPDSFALHQDHFGAAAHRAFAERAMFVDLKSYFRAIR